MRDGLGRVEANPADRVGAQAVLEVPLADGQRLLDDRAVDLQLLEVLAEERQRRPGDLGDRPRKGHEIVDAAAAAVGPVNRVALARLRLIELQVEVLHVLDQGRVLAAGVLEGQQGIDRGVVEESLDVPGHFQAGLGVQPDPVLAFRVGLAADFAAVELPVAAGAGEVPAVVAES